MNENEVEIENDGDGYSRQRVLCPRYIIIDVDID